jgi:hypothetical protein
MEPKIILPDIQPEVVQAWSTRTSKEVTLPDSPHLLPPNAPAISHSHLSKIETTNPGGVIRYSSPKPWILAIVLSLGLWAMLGWTLWRLFH